MKKIHSMILVSVAMLVVPATFVFGEVVGPNSSGDGSVVGSVPPLKPDFKNPLGVDSVDQFVTKVIELLITIGVPIAVLFIIYAGFLFVTARGNEEKVNKAKATLLWTIVGIAVLLGAKIVAIVIENTIKGIGA